MNSIINNLYKLKENMPDLLIREIKVSSFKSVFIICSEGLSNSDAINDFILENISNNYNGIKNIPSINYKEIKENEILYYVLNGFTCVIDKNDIVVFETRANIDRGITEPSSEPTIRGSKDSFTENYQKNIGLIRRRIKSEDLYLEEVTLGINSKTRIGIFYLKEKVNDNILLDLKEKLNTIKNEEIIDANSLREALSSVHSSLIPTLKATEIPNTAARYLLEGRIVLNIENSPSLLIIPSFFIDFFKNNEDYNVKPLFSSFIRVIRVIAFFLSIYLPASYIALTTFDQEIIPTSLLINFSMQRESVAFPSIVEMLILLFTFEILHEGDSKIPNSVGSSLSILGALVLGESAVSAGLISPIIVIIVALSSICSLLFVYHDMQGYIRFYRYFLMALSAFFGIIGLLIGTIFFLIHISTIETFSTSYLNPLVPIKKHSFDDSILRKKGEY